MIGKHIPTRVTFSLTVQENDATKKTRKSIVLNNVILSSIICKSHLKVSTVTYEGR